jgi:hypothetical protein
MAGLISRRELQELKDELVRAMGLNIESENLLRTDLINLTQKIKENNNELKENTKELKILNEYFNEMRENKNIEKDSKDGDDDGKDIEGTKNGNE